MFPNYFNYQIKIIIKNNKKHVEILSADFAVSLYMHPMINKYEGFY